MLEKPEYVTEHLADQSEVWLFSDRDDLVPLPPSMTRACRVIKEPHLSHIEISGGEYGDGVHERYFVKDPRILDCLQDLGHRAVAEFSASKQQRIDYNQPHNKTSDLNWGLFHQPTGENLVEPYTQTGEQSLQKEWDDYPEVTPIEYKLDIGDGQSIIVSNDSTFVVRFIDKPGMDHILLPVGSGLLRLYSFYEDMGEMAHQGFTTISLLMTPEMYKLIRDDLVNSARRELKLLDSSS